MTENKFSLQTGRVHYVPSRSQKQTSQPLAETSSATAQIQKQEIFA